MAEPSFYNQEAAAINKQVDKLNQLNTELDEAFNLWESLENKD